MFYIIFQERAKQGMGLADLYCFFIFSVSALGPPSRLYFLGREDAWGRFHSTAGCLLEELKDCEKPCGLESIIYYLLLYYYYTSISY